MCIRDSSKYVVQNGPPMFLEAECYKNSMFILRAAAALPRLDIGNVEYRPLRDGVYEVSALVKNIGFLPTFGSYRSKQLENVPPLVAELSSVGEEDGEVVGRVEEAEEVSANVQGLDEAAELAGNVSRDESVKVAGNVSRDANAIGVVEVVGKAKKEIGHLDGRSGSTSAFSLWSSRSTGASRVTKVSWVVKAKQGSEIAITVKGQRAGCVTEVVKLEQ